LDNPLKLTDQRSPSEVDSGLDWQVWTSRAGKDSKWQKGKGFVDESNLYLGFSKEVLFPIS